MNAPRLPTVRDLPGISAVRAVFFILAFFVFVFGWRLDVVAREDLEVVTGQIERMERTNVPKTGPQLHIYVRTDQRIVHLIQDDITTRVPKLNVLRSGDRITALARHDSLGRDLDWLWELTRDGEFILSHDQTLASILQKTDRVRPFGYGSAVLGLILAATSLVLRKRFGAWQSAI